MNEQIQNFLQPYQKREVKEYENSVPMDPKVSVVIGAYMQESFISQCLQSVLNQKTNFEFEVLLGDDGSTDGTKKICAEIAEANPGIVRFFSNSRENQILLNNKETPIFCVTYLIGNVRGTYVILTDGDDYWSDENKLQIQVDALEETGADCCQTYWHELDSNELNLIAPPYHNKNDERVFMRPNKWNYHHVSTRLVRFNTLLQIFTRFGVRALNDGYFQRILHDRATIVIVKKPTSVYRRHNKGIWTGLSRNKQLKKQLTKYRILSQWIPEKRYYYGLEKWKVRSHLIFSGRLPRKFAMKWALWCNRIEIAVTRSGNKLRAYQNESPLHLSE